MEKRRVKKHSSAYFILIALLLFRINSSGASADVIIDNGNPGTSFTGTWKVSGGSNPYGADSFWGAGTSAYTWHAGLQSGVYDVYMWWTTYSDRSTSAPVTITHSSGTQTVLVNQQQNGGRWNFLGTFSFDAAAGGLVKLSATGKSTVTVCADAVKFVYLSGGGGNTPPVANNDSATTTQNTPVTINVLANDTDAEGNIAPATVSITSNPAHGSAVPQSNGTVRYTPTTGYAGSDTFRYTVKDTANAVSNAALVAVTVSAVATTTIVDNGAAGTSFTGTWTASGASGYYGANSVWSRDGATYTWRFTPKISGNYQVSAWWTVWPSRSASVPIDIPNSGGTARVYVNQQLNGGRWNILGTYAFQAGVSYRVTMRSQPYPSSTCADAVRFVYVSGDVNEFPPLAIPQSQDVYDSIAGYEVGDAVGLTVGTDTWQCPGGVGMPIVSTIYSPTGVGTNGAFSWCWTKADIGTDQWSAAQMIIPFSFPSTAVGVRVNPDGSGYFINNVFYAGENCDWGDYYFHYTTIGNTGLQTYHFYETPQLGRTGEVLMGETTLYRRDPDGTTTMLADWFTCTNPTYNGRPLVFLDVNQDMTFWMLEAVGTNPVKIRASIMYIDGESDVAPLPEHAIGIMELGTITDSSGQRITTGKPGMYGGAGGDAGAFLGFNAGNE